MIIQIETNKPSAIKALLAFCQALGLKAEQKEVTNPSEKSLYNPAIVAAVERDKAGITTGDVKYSSVEEMYAHFGLNHETGK